MSLFLTPRTVHLPQALNQISLNQTSQQQSPTLRPAKKKKKPSPHAQNLVLQTQVFSLGLNTLAAFAVCFCTNVNYLNHTRWQSTFQTRYRSLVWFLSMLWYTTPVLTKGRTHFVCWCSHLWHWGYVCIASFLLLMFLWRNPAHVISEKP